MTLPNFFIVGAARAGMRSLYHYLGQHPDIYTSPIRQPCTFATDIDPATFTDKASREGWLRGQDTLDEYLAGPMSEPGYGRVFRWEQYYLLFKNVTTERAIGEGSAYYMRSTQAAANIRAKIPHARIIMILRDPAERAFSYWTSSRSAGVQLPPFPEMLRTQLSNEPEFAGGPQLLAPGRYAVQVRRFLDAFGPAQVRIHLFEDFVKDTAAVTRDIIAFLGVDPSAPIETSERIGQGRLPGEVARKLTDRFGYDGRATLKKLIPRPLRRLASSMLFRPQPASLLRSADRALMVKHFERDILDLETLIGRDLSAWRR